METDEDERHQRPSAQACGDPRELRGWGWQPSEDLKLEMDSVRKRADGGKTVWPLFATCDHTELDKGDGAGRSGTTKQNLRRGGHIGTIVAEFGSGQ